MYACIIMRTHNSYAGDGSGPGGDDPPGDGGGACTLVDCASSSVASEDFQAYVVGFRCY